MYREKAHSLATDRETLERIAREQYGMKKEKEDVFITNIP
jgi:cell division protein FtsB